MLQVRSRSPLWAAAVLDPPPGHAYHRLDAGLAFVSGREGEHEGLELSHGVARGWLCCAGCG
jgi:hypothetical protein